jgi:hypothetical protein
MTLYDNRCGITLTGADRVIVYDPSWNPAEDRYVHACTDLLHHILVNHIVVDKLWIEHFVLDKQKMCLCID